MSQPDLAISIVNHSNPEMLRDCIRSIYATAQGVTFEIWVIDNATGGRLVPEIQAEFPGVRWLFNNVRRGFSDNHNQVLERVRRGEVQARYACILNDDMIVHEGAFDVLVAFMDAHPDAGMAGARLLNADGSIQNCAFREMTLWSELVGNYILPRSLCHLKSEVLIHPALNADAAAPVDWVLGACIVIRPEVLQGVGLLDAELSPIANTEEVDWCRRTRGAGWRVYHVPNARITHFGGQSLQGPRLGPDLFRVEMIRTRIGYLRKHFGLLQALALRLGLALALPWNALLLVAGRVRRRQPLRELWPELQTLALVARMSLFGWVPPFARDRGAAK